MSSKTIADLITLFTFTVHCSGFSTMYTLVVCTRYIKKQVGILVDVFFLFGKFQLEQNIQRLLFMGY